MSLTTVIPPTVEVERASREQIARHLVDDAETNRLPYPMTVQMSSPGRVAVFFDRDTERDIWRDFLGSAYATFHGASIALYSVQAVAEAMDRTEQIRQAASFADVPAAPEPSTACRSCGGEVVHQMGCAAEAPAAICMYCPTVLPLTPEGRIGEHDTADANGTPCAGSGEWPATDWGDEVIPAGTRAALVAWLAVRWPECVDCGVPGGGHQESCAFAVPVIVGTPAEVAEQLAERLAGHVDLDAAAQIPVEVIPDPAPARDIDEKTVSQYFDGHNGHRWDDLNDAQRTALVTMCAVSGWFGDWNAAYWQVTSDDSLRLTADDARLVVSELDDLTAVSLAQLAETVGVEPDAPIEYVHTTPLPQRIPGAALAANPVPALDEPTQEIPHRGTHRVPLGLPLLVNGHEPVEPHEHEPVAIVEVVAVDPDLDADERSGAEMARLNGEVTAFGPSGRDISYVPGNGCEGCLAWPPTCEHAAIDLTRVNGGAS